MIGKLSGQLAYRSAKFIILETGGVGYRVFISDETLRQLPTILGAELALWTHLAVRENALDLYGFAARAELEFFELLLSVSGVGPKSALAILSLAPPETLTKAITASDSAYLTRVSGIGRKSAEKIIIELRDKVVGLGGGGGVWEQESEALKAPQPLGYGAREAREALKQVDPTLTDLGDKVRAALKLLVRHR